MSQWQKHILSYWHIEKGHFHSCQYLLLLPLHPGFLRVLRVVSLYGIVFVFVVVKPFIQYTDLV